MVAHCFAKYRDKDACPGPSDRAGTPYEPRQGVGGANMIESLLNSFKQLKHQATVDRCFRWALTLYMVYICLLFLAVAYVEISSRTRTVERVEDPRIVQHSFNDLEALVARAMFSQTELVFAEPEKIGKYSVRLALGGVWDDKRKEVRIETWALITKPDDVDWSPFDAFELFLVRDDESRTTSTVFAYPDQPCPDLTLRDRPSLVVAALDVVYAERNLKLIRFTHYHSLWDLEYFEYVNGGSLKVRLELMEGGGISPRT